MLGSSPVALFTVSSEVTRRTVSAFTVCSPSAYTIAIAAQSNIPYLVNLAMPDCTCRSSDISFDGRAVVSQAANTDI
jgi:hypothetical protein